MDSDGLFNPTEAQSLAKVRFQARWAEVGAVRPLESVTLEDMVEWSGTAWVRRWLQQAEFAAWFVDKDTFAKRLAAGRDLALKKLYDTLEAELVPKLLTQRDKLKAAEMIMQLTGSYPAKRVVKFLDRDLDAMDEGEVDRQLAAATKLVGPKSP